MAGGIGSRGIFLLFLWGTSACPSLGFATAGYGSRVDSAAIFSPHGGAASLGVATGTTTEETVVAGEDVTTSTIKRSSTFPPSWETLSRLLGNETEMDASPLVTLYRDTNGWCPFCERVWVALRAKGIPYRERLVNLRDKPDWYKELIPTALVPAVLFHHPDGAAAATDNNKNERRIVWESMDIMKALDLAFPETEPLFWDAPEFDVAMEMQNELQAAGFAYVFASRNQTLTDEELDDRRQTFLNRLSDLDAALADTSSAGTFRLGVSFSAVDACMIPSLERWRYQLPLTMGLDILDGRPHLQRWFDAMDNFAPYADRVAGDEYSWTAVASAYQRYFAGDEGDPRVAAVIERADAAAAKLSEAFATDNGTGVPVGSVREAVRVLVSNHGAIVQDCTRTEPMSQKHLPRAASEATADEVLRCAGSLLLQLLEAQEGSDKDENCVALDRAASMPALTELLRDAPVEERNDGALAARTVAARLCVPRDMGAPAAKALRAVLSMAADRLEEGR